MRPIDLARYLLCLPFFIMLFLMLMEASLHATTTYLVIQAGRDVAQGRFLLADLLWILASESAAYAIGAISWIFAERTGLDPTPILSAQHDAISAAVVSLEARLRSSSGTDAILTRFRLESTRGVLRFVDALLEPSPGLRAAV